MDEEQIRMIPLFEELSEVSIERLKAKIKTSYYSKKEKIFSENQEATEISFVLSGLVRITKSCSCGKEVILGFRKPMEACSAIPIFSKEKPVYCVTAQMSLAGTILSIPVHELEEMVKMEPELAIKIMQFSQSKMVEYTTTIRNLALFDKNKALIAILIKLAEEYGIQGEKGIDISIPLSHQEIASMIATSREHVSRSLSDLAHQNIIETGRRVISILDMEKLCEMAGTEGFD